MHLTSRFNLFINISINGMEFIIQALLKVFFRIFWKKNNWLFQLLLCNMCACWPQRRNIKIRHWSDKISNNVTTMAADPIERMLNNYSINSEKSPINMHFILDFMPALPIMYPFNYYIQAVHCTINLHSIQNYDKVATSTYVLALESNQQYADFIA